MTILAKDSLYDIEQSLLLSVNDEVKLKALAKVLNETRSAIEHYAGRGALSTEELCLFDEQAARIKHIATLFASLEKSGCDVLKDTTDRMRYILINDKRFKSSQVEAQEQSLKMKSEANPMQETLNSKLLRQWFLDHVADPFPSKRTKDDLVLTTNALVQSSSTATNKRTAVALSNQPIDYSQCTLWFINSRRRSHWTDFYRHFAHSDKGRMRLLVEFFKREEEGEAVEPTSHSEELIRLLRCPKPSDKSCCQDAMEVRVRECREIYTHMMNWLRQITKEQVGDWMDEIVQEAKLELKQEKRLRLEERKRGALVPDKKANEERKRHKRKSSNVEFEESSNRRSDRNQKRKIVERTEVEQHQPVQGWSNRSDHDRRVTQFSDSATESYWTSNDSSLRVSSSSSSSSILQASPATTVSSFSMSSYDAFPNVPRSPTLNITGHKSLARDLDRPVLKEEDDPAPINAASLYTSNFARSSQVLPPGKSSPSIVVHPLPEDDHLEQQLSGGSRIKMSPSSSFTGSITPAGISPSIPYLELQQQELSTPSKEAEAWIKSSPK
ncbi:hypothetical protein CBS101457_002619 [Exobasidium rhododendri]|nr:hypothetical protein CBS101457_002619 [Exobasidium rhododendri]